ncbi:50S ribosomal protein L29 [bacterium]|nr:50S ribosomal protein L29 [bacterium]MBU1653140.1 50S ribosomal protein L29 [bacterium]
MKMSEINQLTRDEIQQRFEDTREELLNLRFQLATHQLDNQVKIRLVRRNLARMVTVLHEFELGIRKEPGKANG